MPRSAGGGPIPLPGTCWCTTQSARYGRSSRQVTDGDTRRASWRDRAATSARGVLALGYAGGGALALGGGTSGAHRQAEGSQAVLHRRNQRAYVASDAAS